MKTLAACLEIAHGKRHTRSTLDNLPENSNQTEHQCRLLLSLLRLLFAFFFFFSTVLFVVFTCHQVITKQQSSSRSFNLDDRKLSVGQRETKLTALLPFFSVCLSKLNLPFPLIRMRLVLEWKTLFIHLLTQSVIHLETENKRGIQRGLN